MQCLIVLIRDTVCWRGQFLYRSSQAWISLHSSGTWLMHCAQLWRLNSLGDLSFSLYVSLSLCLSLSPHTPVSPRTLFNKLLLISFLYTPREYRLVWSTTAQWMMLPWKQTCAVLIHYTVFPSWLVWSTLVVCWIRPWRKPRLCTLVRFFFIRSSSSLLPAPSLFGTVSFFM